jgi:hypothetical protein
MERPNKTCGVEEMQKLNKDKKLTPKLEGDWSADFKDFATHCLIKNVHNPNKPQRATA